MRVGTTVNRGGGLGGLARTLRRKAGSLRRRLRRKARSVRRRLLPSRSRLDVRSWIGKPTSEPSPIERRAAIEPDSQYPPSFELTAIREYHPEFAQLDDATLLQMHRAHPEGSGLRTFRILDRNAFIALAGADRKILEIGPFHRPLLTGPNVQYFDVFDRDELLVRAVENGFSTERVPDVIHHVSPIADLSIVDDRFDAVISSHNIEHQPDLVRHLEQVGDLLDDDGRYFLIIPDHRYCFDHFLAPSTTAAVIDAYLERRTRHSRRTVLEHRAHTGHNISIRHWAGDHGDPTEDRIERMRGAIDELTSSGDRYIDAHAWQFTPDSFAEIIDDLRALDLCDFEVERLYPTVRNDLEFWAILRRSPVG